MPELPEVRVASQAINEKIKNKTIVKVEIWLPKLIKEIDPITFSKTLVKQKVRKVFNIGKFIVFDLEQTMMLSHLRMTGKYSFYQKRRDLLEPHTHLIFYFADNSELHYQDYRQFGTFYLRSSDNYLELKPLKSLAQEPAQIDLNDFYKQAQKSSRAIKNFLLDQSKVLGLGNIYVNETLWMAKIRPDRQANQISKAKLNKILKSASKIMDASTLLGGSTIDSYASLNQKQGQYQKFLKIHGKQNQQCERCFKLIKKIKLHGRGTYYCPVCQK